MVPCGTMQRQLLHHRTSSTWQAATTGFPKFLSVRRYSTMRNLSILVSVAIILASVAGFQLTTRPAAFSRLRMLSDVPADAPKEWVGAKKFSMKDRYTETVLSNEQIAKILPHRYPFLLVDRVVEFEAGKRAVGIKCVTANEPQFTGHFPDRPIMPGVLMIEAMAQLGGIICLSPPINEEGGGRLFFFTGVNGVRWKSPVTPGDQLIMEMSLVNFDDRLGFATMTGKGYVGGKLCVQVEEFTFALAKS